MTIFNELKLVKDFVEFSIQINRTKKFLLPQYDKNNDYQKVLYKAILELKREGVIDINLSSKGQMVIKFKNNVI